MASQVKQFCSESGKMLFFDLCNKYIKPVDDDGDNGYSVFCGINIFRSVIFNEEVLNFLGFRGSLQEQTRKLISVLNEIPHDDDWYVMIDHYLNDNSNPNKYLVISAREFEILVTMLDSPAARYIRGLFDLGKSIIMKNLEYQHDNAGFNLPCIPIKFSSQFEPSSWVRMSITPEMEPLPPTIRELRALITKLEQKFDAEADHRRALEEKQDRFFRGLEYHNQKLERKFVQMYERLDGQITQIRKHLDYLCRPELARAEVVFPANDRIIGNFFK